MTAVKICGCTSRGDVELALAWGATFVGFIFAESPRRVSIDHVAAIAHDLPETVFPVAVLVNPEAAHVQEIVRAVPRVQIQLSGDETPEFAASIAAPVIKAIHLTQNAISEAELHAACNRFPRARILFDSKVGSAYGGTGQTFAWEQIAPIARQREIFVAGGLTPTNVGGCVRSLRPFAVDVRSGVETDGAKDPVKVHAFCQAVKDANET